MKLRSLIGMAIVSVAMLSSCDVLMSSLSSTANMMNCKYEYNSIAAISVGGINTADGVSVANVLKLTNLLAQAGSANGVQSLPLSFTLNIDVTNPSAKAAAMSALDYIVSIDNLQLTQGQLPQGINIPANGAAVMPLRISVDAAQLVTGESGSTVLNLAKNLLGIGGIANINGSQPSQITLQLRPSFNINGVPMAIPNYVPVSFAIGGTSLR